MTPASTGAFDAFILDEQVVQRREPRLPRVRWIYDVRKFLAARSHLYMLIKTAKRAWRALRAHTPTPPTRQTSGGAPMRSIPNTVSVLPESLHISITFSPPPGKS